MSDLISRQAAVEAFRKELCKEREYIISFKGCERVLNELPIVEPIKMMCNGEHIKCPAHKDYKRGYKDGQAEAQMKAEPKHGRWLDRESAPWGQVYETCSVCLERQTLDYGLDHFCPICGARMNSYKQKTEGRENER